MDGLEGTLLAGICAGVYPASSVKDVGLMVEKYPVDPPTEDGRARIGSSTAPPANATCESLVQS